MARKQQGKIIPNGVLLKEHEYKTVLFFTERGYDVELIPPTNSPKSKSPDIIMQGLVWEMKSPQGKGKNNVSNNLKKASKQSANIIFDFRRYNKRIVKSAIREAINLYGDSRRIKRMYVITDDEELLIPKKSY